MTLGHRPSANRLGSQAFLKAATSRPGGNLPVVATDDDLHNFVVQYVGLSVPRTRCCPHHVAPFQALADAFFARYPVIIIEASRGSGKSVLIAVLGFCEAVLLGAQVNLLGGSGEQAQRIHSYTTGDDPSFPHTFWNNPRIPRELLLGDPMRSQTKLQNGGIIRVLTASHKSVHGPHPHRLRVDEADVCDPEILDAALLQPMPARGISAQTLIGSTPYTADGTFAEIKHRAEDEGLPILRWCYKATLVSNGGWLPDEAIVERRKMISAAQWELEMELTEPNPEGRAIVPAKVDQMFDRELGHIVTRRGANFYKEFQEPIEHARYATGADWAKEQDKTVILTLRTDVRPMKVVAIRVVNRLSWPAMVDLFNAQVAKYRGKAGHDNTGIGDVLDDYIVRRATPFTLVGKRRSELFQRYIAAIEDQQIKAPMIDMMYREHKFCSVNDLSGTGHPPDTFIAGAIAYEVGRSHGWSRAPGRA